MCTLCAATTVFDPARHPGATNGDLASILETLDAPADTSTAYVMAVGDTFSGNLGSVGDIDWVRIDLVAGQSYAINLNASGSGAGTLNDAYLRVHNASGGQVAFNDDGGPGVDSALNFLATTTGSYYISAGSYNNASAGTYVVEVTQAAPPEPPASLDTLANFLTDGYWQGSGRAARSFDTAADNQISVNISALTEEGRQLARWAFEAWEMVANIDFVEVTGTADITFDDDESGAFASSTTSGGVILSSSVNVSTDWLASSGTTIDSYSFQTYVHEIGHALGLGHQGGYNGSATYGTDEDFSNDSWQISVMSYFDQTENTTTNASRAALLGTMMADIVAIQNLYGSAGSGSATAGNTTWGANSTFGGYLGQYFAAISTGIPTAIYDGDPVAYTIYDRSGIDTFDLSFSGTNDRIDMRAEQFSDINGLIGNIGIARGTVLENVIAGTGNDTVLGNSAANTIDGSDGEDDLRGGSNADTLHGGDDNDTLRGESGHDEINGDSGADVLSGSTGNDTLRGGDDNDTLYGGDNNDLLAGNDGADDLRGGNGNDRGFGGEGNDTLRGEAGADELGGDNGDDVLSGSAGDDTLSGGNNNDDLFGGDNNDLLSGNNGNDSLSGGTGNDRMFGGAGLDTLVGGAGQDALSGGADADVFVFSGISDSPHGSTRDTITDFQDGLDRIDLSGFAGTLTFVGSAFTGGANQVRYDSAIGRLYIDTDGGGASDFSIDITTAPTITGADLIL